MGYGGIFPKTIDLGALGFPTDPVDEATRFQPRQPCANMGKPQK